MAAKLLLAGVLLGAMVLLPTPADAWQVAACVAADTSATPYVSTCVARGGSPSLPVVCTSHVGFVQTPTSSPGAAAEFFAAFCT